MHQDLGARLKEACVRIEMVKEGLGIDLIKEKIAALEAKAGLEGSWKDVESITAIMQEKKRLEALVEDFVKIQTKASEAEEILGLAWEDKTIMAEMQGIVDDLEVGLKSLEMKVFFKNEEDFFGAFIEINAGAGGVDSQDWVSKMGRMYAMWGEKRGYKVNVIDSSPGEEAGFKKLILEFIGDFAFGYLQNENGVHRLVRISPFNANGKRQTSFASVFAYPAVNEDVSVSVLPKDLRIETFRSSGAGGQHVNTTDSAVRIVHIPTGIVAQSQSQRSQNQNKAQAMKMLLAKLYKLELDKKNEEKINVENSKTDISWGNQIRNYVFNPYKLIKDLRSSYETSNVERVMDGDLDDLIRSVMKSRVKKEEGGRPAPLSS